MNFEISLKELIVDEFKINESYASNQIDIDGYVRKLLENARFQVETDSKGLTGFVAYYANDLSSRVGYISQLIIRKDLRSQGLGKSLILSAINDMEVLGMRHCRLEVAINNTRAIKLYSLLGFELENSSSKTSYYMLTKIG